MSEMKVTSEGSLSVSSALLSAWSWPFILKDLEEGVEGKCTKLLDDRKAGWILNMMNS